MCRHTIEVIITHSFALDTTLNGINYKVHETKKEISNDKKKRSLKRDKHIVKVLCGSFRVLVLVYLIVYRYSFCTVQREFDMEMILFYMGFVLLFTKVVVLRSNIDFKILSFFYRMSQKYFLTIFLKNTRLESFSSENHP